MQYFVEIVISTIPFFTWLYLLFFYANRKLQFNELFWKSNIKIENQKIHRGVLKQNFSICFIIPARNEQKYIAQTIKSILSQKIKKFVLIVDDNSSDNTEKKAKQTFRKAKFSQFKILKGKKLPINWSGKVWALKQGVDAAIKKKFSHFVFIDADIILKDRVIGKTLNFMTERRLSMLSLMAKLRCVTFWENLLIPSFIYFFQKLYPFSKVNNHNDNVAAAAGGFIMCKTELFKKINLYELIKDKIIDDCNLAKIIKDSGNHIWLGLTNLVESQRNYSKLEQVWKMVTRTAYEQLNNSILVLIVSIIGMVMIYLMPFINLIHQNSINLIIINLASIFLMFLSFLPTAKFYNLNFVFYFSLPISSIIYMLMTINSAYNYYFKNGNVWKGRKY